MDTAKSEQQPSDGGTAVRAGDRPAGTGTGATYSDSLLLVSLSQFYAQDDHIHRITPVINCVSDVSLRLLDWFVTNYSKKHNVIIPRTCPNGGGTQYFNVYLSYRAQLKAYSKHHFDPFRRRDRIEYFYEPERSIHTTIGQLNFFRWVIQNRILEYIAEHSAAIEADMMRSKSKTSAKRRQAALRRDAEGSEESEAREEEEPRPISPRAGAAAAAACENGRKQAAKQKQRSADRSSASVASIEPPRVSHLNGSHVVRFD